MITAAYSILVGGISNERLAAWQREQDRIIATGGGPA